MGCEIERKFLVKDNGYITMSTDRVHIMQGYLSARKEATVRVRLWNDSGFITVKGPNRGAVRSEWEYPIPADDAREMLLHLAEGGVIDKTRYIVPYREHTWEVDCFHGRLEGLVVAEVELDSESETVDLPPFIGEEVTGDPQYYNSNLSAKA